MSFFDIKLENKLFELAWTIFELNSTHARPHPNICFVNTRDHIRLKLTPQFVSVKLIDFIKCKTSF